MRRILVLLIVTMTASAVNAGDVKFSLNLDAFSWTPNQDVRTTARRAVWNHPMGRLQYQFEQQQAWIMRGTMPGGERDRGLAIRVKAQNGLPLNLIAAAMQGGLDIAQQEVARIGPRAVNDEEFEAMTLEEQMSELLGRRLVPQ